MDRQILPEFQKYLLDKKLVLERNAPYYAYWVSRFLTFLNNSENLNKEICIEEFLNQLGENNDIADWQIRQAYDALRLYLDHFSKGDSKILFPNETGKDKFSLDSIIKKGREIIRMKHYSYKTERSYINWIKRFFYYLNEVKKKNLVGQELSSDDVRNYLTYLAINKKVSASTQNQAFNALLFLFRDILSKEITGLDKTIRAKRGIKIPVVLSVDEVRKIFKHLKGLNLLAVRLLYGSGLRLMELARMRIQDIDFDSNLLFIRGSKGDKDRSTILPESIKPQLQKHLEKVKMLHQKDIDSGYGEVYLPNALERKYPNAGKNWGWQYVFPSERISVDPRSGKIRRHHMSEKTIQNAVRDAVRESGIVKHATVHTLRHSFATHLLMNGVNIREVQDLLGHKNVETTMIYTHVLRDMSNAPKSPLDQIYDKPKKNEKCNN